MFLIDKLFNRSKLSKLVYSVYQQLDTIKHIDEVVYDDDYAYGEYSFTLPNGNVVTVDALNRIAINNVRVYHRSAKHIYKRVKSIHANALIDQYQDQQSRYVDQLGKLLNE